MVSPLFLEIFGGVILLTLLWVVPIYFTTKKERETKRKKLDKKSYRKALKDFKNKPGDLEAVWYLGHIYYSHQFPDVANYPFLELTLNDPDLPTPKEIRDELIEKDIKKILGKKAA